MGIVMITLDAYLEKIQTDESIFPMDQFSTNDNPVASSPKEPEDKSGKIKKKEHFRNIFPENTPIHKRRVMVDFDRTIHKYSRSWEDGTPYDPPFPYARDSINILKSMGFEIVIFTARLSSETNDADKQRSMLEDWFREYDIYYDRMTAEKLPAEFYIDDKALRIEDGNWGSVINSVKEIMGLSEEF
jgi:phosphoglycolate phosphatase-like HAD superfamily hydrolase